MDLYRDPEVYDLVYRSGTADQFASLQKIAALSAIPAEGPWLETACGSARLLVEAEKAGIAVAGFDREPAMVDYARSRLSPAANLSVCDLESCSRAFEPRSIPFAFTLINTIRHLESDAAVLAHFGEMAKVLTRGGVYVVGLSLHDRARAEIEEDLWQGSEAGITVTELSTSLPPENESRFETIVSHLTIERSGEPPEHRDASFPLRVYSQKAWETLVASSMLAPRGTFDLWGDAATAFDGRYVLYALGPREESAEQGAE